MNYFIEEMENKRIDNSWTNCNFAMSKLGVIAMTRVLAAREPGMRINCFCPGNFDTELTAPAGSRTPAQGAETGVMLATIRKNGPTGKLFLNGLKAEW